MSAETTAESAPRSKASKGPLDLVMRALGSYWLSVGVLTGMFLLTYFGTLQQVEDGLYIVQQEYFYSYFVVQEPIQLFPLPVRLPFPLPLPGGFVLMGLLSINLFVGGLVRIRKSQRTFGILVTHVGMAFLMAAGLVKIVDSEDGYVALAEGESSGWFQSHYLWDLVIYDAPLEDSGGGVREWVVPQEQFADLGSDSRKFSAAGLPFDLELAHYEDHAQVLPVGPMWQSPAPDVNGYAIRPLPNQPEAESHVPALWAKATVNGQPQELLLWGAARFPAIVETAAAEGDVVTAEGGGGSGRYALALRKRRYEFPWEIRLEEFFMDEHPGTSMASEYRSDVTHIDEGRNTRLRIEMNKPMRRDGYILYQASYGRRASDGELYSQFAVVRNPSDQWPKYACYVIGIGMALAFGQRLIQHIKKQNAQRAKAVA
ncbi:MAG: cytochrome c biogenesis protein ResB [Planctomycetota bacterium]|jgi:hypothetical protein